MSADLRFRFIAGNLCDSRVLLLIKKGTRKTSQILYSFKYDKYLCTISLIFIVVIIHFAANCNKF